MKSWIEMLAVIMAYLGSVVAGVALAMSIPGVFDAPKDQVGAEWLLAKVLIFVGGSVMAGLGGIMWVLLRSWPGTQVGFQGGGSGQSKQGAAMLEDARYVLRIVSGKDLLSRVARAQGADGPSPEIDPDAGKTVCLECVVGTNGELNCKQIDCPSKQPNT